MSAATEQHNRSRAAARREILGRNGETNGLSVFAAFNAGFDAGRGHATRPDGWQPDRSNHYFVDGVGDPATCVENHNHPEEGS